MSRIRDVVAWDLDSTVRSTAHRRGLIPLIEAGEATWDHYGLACADDEPVEGAVALMRMLFPYYRQVAISFAGGGQAAEKLTTRWCVRHDVPLDEIIMPPDGTHGMDKGAATEFKITKLIELKRHGWNVQLYVEDYAPIARAIRERTGVPVLGVNPFDKPTGLLA